MAKGNGGVINRAERICDRDEVSYLDNPQARRILVPGITKRPPRPATAGTDLGEKLGGNAQVEIKGVIPTDVLNNKIKVGGGKENVGTGQIPKTRKKMNREFRGGYGAGIDDMKGMGAVDIVRVVEGDLNMSRLVHYHRHGGEEVSEKYLKGWAQAIKDAHKKTGEGKG